MPPRFNQSKLNAAVQQLRTASNDLKRYGRQLEAAGRELDRESRRAQSKLRQLPSSQPPVSLPESILLNSVREHVAADPIERPHDIFLSHATADLPLARALHDELEALDTEVWMDDFSIKLGQNIIRAIDRVFRCPG